MTLLLWPEAITYMSQRPQRSLWSAHSLIDIHRLSNNNIITYSAVLETVIVSHTNYFKLNVTGNNVIGILVLGALKTQHNSTLTTTHKITFRSSWVIFMFPAFIWIEIMIRARSKLRNHSLSGHASCLLISPLLVTCSYIVIVQKSKPDMALRSSSSLHLLSIKMEWATKPLILHLGTCVEGFTGWL